ncbi:uncharacterized, partial [Tachysurus ichikawai]
SYPLSHGDWDLKDQSLMPDMNYPQGQDFLIAQHWPHMFTSGTQIDLEILKD